MQVRKFIVNPHIIISNSGANLHHITMQFDLVIAENLNRIDPRANWQMTPRSMFAKAPILCFIPTKMENLQNARYAPYGNQHQPIRSVSDIPVQYLRPSVEVLSSTDKPILAPQVLFILSFSIHRRLKELLNNILGW